MPHDVGSCDAEGLKTVHRVRLVQRGPPGDQHKLRVLPYIVVAAVIGTTAAAVVAFRVRGRSLPGRLITDSNSVRLDAGKDGAPIDRSFRAEFHLVNDGDQPVQITAIESGCGCAKPTARPSLVAPGASTTVEVTATPLPVGERTVTIRVLTDSKLTPEIPLHIRMVTHSKPPFVINASGDLSFVDWTPEGGPRYLLVTTAERDGQSTPPLIECDLPYVGISLIDTSAKPYPDPGISQFTYKFALDLRQVPPGKNFQGVVRVLAPWDRVEAANLNLFGSIRQPLRSAPVRLIAKCRDGKLASNPRIILSWELPAGSSDLSITSDEACPVKLEPQHPQAATFSICTLNAKAGRVVREGSYSLRARSSSGGDELVIPVLIKEEGAQ